MTRPAPSLYRYTPGEKGSWDTLSRSSIGGKLYFNYVTLDSDTAAGRPGAAGRTEPDESPDSPAGQAGRTEGPAQAEDFRQADGAAGGRQEPGQSNLHLQPAGIAAMGGARRLLLEEEQVYGRRRPVRRRHQVQRRQRRGLAETGESG